MTIVFNISATPLGIASGMDKNETVRIDTSSNFTNEGGMLAFVVDGNFIIYAPGTWGIVTTTFEE